MNFWTAFGLATLFLITAIVIFATKVFFPYHRLIALSIYGIGWIPFLYSLHLKKRLLFQHQTFITTFFTAFLDSYSLWNYNDDYTICFPCFIPYCKITIY